MKKKILLIDNGFKKDKPFIINSFEKNESIHLRILYNFLKKEKFSIVERLFNRFRVPLDTSNFNKRILLNVKDFKPDFIVIIKGNNVYRKTLNKIKLNNSNIKIFSWTADNMIKKHNTSRYFDKSINKYDIHFTTKSNIIDKLYLKGAKEVVFLNKAYSKFDHYPEKYDKNYDFNVLFIGSSEIDRFNSMKYLAERGIKVNIFGNMWEKYKTHENLIIHKKPLLGKEYRLAISSSKITLCFLRQINDDLQTDRTMEIPATKGFMMAERTKEHKKLFLEDYEATYFSSDEELLRKVEYFLKSNKEREKIRSNGYKRAINSGYSFDDMTKIICTYFN